MNEITSEKEMELALESVSKKIRVNIQRSFESWNSLSDSLYSIAVLKLREETLAKAN